MPLAPNPAPILPPIYPQLQVAMMGMMKVMTYQFQGQLTTPPPQRRHRTPAHNGEPAYRTWVKT